MSGPPVRLAIIATHPIQYQVPLYRALAQTPGMELRVLYGLIPDEEQQGVGFGVGFEWDVPLLDGYDYEILTNAARDPGLRGFFDHSTPGVGEALGRIRPDAVLITGWHTLSMFQALRACMRLDVPRLIRGESNALRPRPFYKRFLHRRLLARYDAFLAIGESNRDFYLDNGVPPGRIFPCRYFVDNERFEAQARRLRGRREEIRAGWGVPDDATCFLFVGKLVPKKRPFDLLEAVGIAAEDGLSIHLLVVGDGPLRAEAERFVLGRDLPATFTGFLNQTEVSRAYVAGDCLVLPSDYGETWGLVVNESMASGLPAVVSDRVGCAPDLIDVGETGAVFPFGDVRALARRLREAAGDPERLQEMGGRARERVGAYSVEAARDGVLAALGFVTGTSVTTAERTTA